MSDHVSLEPLLDALAERVAAKLGNRFGERDGEGAVQPRLLNVTQAAAYLGRTKEAVQHMIASRKLPVVRDGRRVFLDLRDLDRWIEQNRA